MSECIKTMRWWCAQGACRMQMSEAYRFAVGVEDSCVGGYELTGFQQRAVHRLANALTQYGGAILADATGMGKTRVALAVVSWWMRLFGEDALQNDSIFVCVPARLRDAWRKAVLVALGESVATSQVVVCSHEELSRKGWEGETLPGFVIVDEAHRFRNPKTRRYDALVRLSRRASVLMVTASPVCHGVQDLEALLRVFWGNGMSAQRAGHGDWWRLLGVKGLDADAVTRLMGEVVVRRGALVMEGELRKPSQRIQRVSYEAGRCEGWVWRNLDTEMGSMGLHLFGGTWSKGLFTELIWRRWESGASALSGTLKRLVVLHERALEQSHEDGDVCRSAASLKDVFGQEMAQEVMPFLFDEVHGESCSRTGVKRDLELLNRVIGRVEQARLEMLGGGGLVGVLCELFEGDWSGEKVCCFTSSAEGARGFYRAMCQRMPCEAIGVMTGQGAWVTGLGKSKPAEFLGRFAPQAQGKADVYQGDKAQIRIAIVTDCLSEGVDLQDCGYVVMLDFPATPLGLVQRLGRFTRAGSPHEEVVVVWPRPSSWKDSLGMRRRLEIKAKSARDAAVGYGGIIGDFFESEQRQAGLEHELWRGYERVDVFWRRLAGEVVKQGLSMCYEMCCEDDGVVYVLWREGSERAGWVYGWWRVKGGKLEDEVWRFGGELIDERVLSREVREVGLVCFGDVVPQVKSMITQRQEALWSAYLAPVSARGGLRQLVLERMDSEEIKRWLMREELREGFWRMVQECVNQGGDVREVVVEEYHAQGVIVDAFNFSDFSDLPCVEVVSMVKGSGFWH